jgi:glycosyltransferase involved in cell wall biosynthesis
VIEEGVTGYLVDEIDTAVDAVKRIGTISRRQCREEFERRFTAPRMARDYVAIYERLLRSPLRRTEPAGWREVQAQKVGS